MMNSARESEASRRWRAAAETHSERREPDDAVQRLQGLWKLKRITGPPMVGMYKTISGGRGELEATWSPFPPLPFDVIEEDDRIKLAYSYPFTAIQDYLRQENDGAWLGRATVCGYQFAWFRMVRS